MTKSFALGALAPERIAALITKMQRDPLVASSVSIREPEYQWSGRPVGSSASLQEFCSPVEDQLSFGTCTANSVVGACELILKRGGRFTDDLSRMFNYWWAGVIDQSQGQDIGRQPRSAALAAMAYGLCREATEPYAAEEIVQAPSAAAEAEGALHKLTKFSRVSIDPDDVWSTVAALKKPLSDGVPVTMAFHCHRWVFDIQGPLSSHYLQPGTLIPGGARSDHVGNHEVLVVGYCDTADSTGGYFLVRNSWGTSWGDQGYWAMPYPMTQAAFEFWAIEEFDGLGVPS